MNKKSLTAIALAAMMLPAAALAQTDLLDNALDMLRGGDDDSSAGVGSLLGNQEIADGLREALQVGTDRVVTAIGRTDGFNADPEIHIPLPNYMQDVQSALELIGAGDMGKDLELKLNRAAEAAVPEARELFVDAITQMTLEDVKAIYNGPDDAATRFFQRTMTPGLQERMRPIVTAAMSEVGAVQSYDAMMSSYANIPLMPDVKGELSDYAVGKTMDGLFYKLAIEEAAIRQDPAKRTTALLQKVFGS